MPGDLLLLPAGIPYKLSSGVRDRCRPFDHSMKQELMTAAGDLILEGSGAVTTFVCAGYDYDLDAAQSLMALLPPVVHVPADPVRGRDIATLIDLLAGEAGRHDPGARVATARLIDLLLVAAIRRWAVDDTPDRPASWLTALRDPTLARVLALLHEDPARAWTIESLAGEVHLSRATLARRFTHAVGVPPLSYLAAWRMNLAAHRLRTTDRTIDAIAREVGYSSEYAFNRAFARHRGQPPGRYRHLAATPA